jgi:anti-sigma B factor antagonist
MQINESTHNGWTVFTLAGRIDHYSAEALKAALMPRLTGGAVALDFAGVDYITSQGFRVLLIASKEQLAKKGRLVLGNMNEPLRAYFNMADLGTVFTIVQDIHLAIDQAP